MLREIDYGFEKVNIEGRMYRRKTQCVWLGCKDKNPQKLFISSDLMEKLGWKYGTKVELMKSSDGKTLALKKVEHIAGFPIRMYGKSGAVNSTAFAVNVFSAMRVAYHKDIFEYDAKVLDDFIIFYPKNN